MANSADPDQLASFSEANWSWSTPFAKARYIHVQQDRCHMKSLNETETLIFILKCVCCFQMQPLCILLLLYFMDRVLLCDHHVDEYGVGRFVFRWFVNCVWICLLSLLVSLVGYVLCLWLNEENIIEIIDFLPPIGKWLFSTILNTLYLYSQNHFIEKNIL